MRQLGVRLAVAVGATLALGAATSSAGAACHEPVVVASFVSGQDIPESVTTDDDGNLYVTNGGSILKRPPGGTFSVFATLPLPVFALGVKVGPDGCVYNVSTSLSEQVEGAFVWRICEENAVEVFAELDPTGAPNDLAFTDDGSLYVTDPVLGRIWKVDAGGNPSVFADHPLLDGVATDPALVFRPLGANGIAVDKRSKNLFVSNTDQASVVRIPLTGSSHAPELFVQNAALRGADGVAFDQSGTLFVAVNGRDALVSIKANGHVSEVESGPPLDSPSSLVFGATHADKHELYLVSSAFLRTLGIAPGTPAPALLRLRASTPGLRLP